MRSSNLIILNAFVSSGCVINFGASQFYSLLGFLKVEKFIWPCSNQFNSKELFGQCILDQHFRNLSTDFQTHQRTTWHLGRWERSKSLRLSPSKELSTGMCNKKMVLAVLRQIKNSSCSVLGLQLQQGQTHHNTAPNILLVSFSWALSAVGAEKERLLEWLSWKGRSALRLRVILLTSICKLEFAFVYSFFNIFPYCIKETILTSNFCWLCINSITAQQRKLQYVENPSSNFWLSFHAIPVAIFKVLLQQRENAFSVIEVP